MLGTAIRKSNGVRSSSVTGTITSLSSIESRLGVVISNSVGVGVRRRLIGVSWLSVVGWSGVDNRGMISWSSVDNRGVVSWSSVDNRGVISWSSVDNRGVIGWGVVDNRGMINRGMVDNWGMVDNRGMVSWGGMVNWCSMDNRGMISRGMMDNRGGMVSSKMSDWSVSTVCWLDLRKSLRVIYLVDRGVGSSKSLGLDNASLFSIRSGD